MWRQKDHAGCGDSTTFAWVAALADENHSRLPRLLVLLHGRALERAVVLHSARKASMTSPLPRTESCACDVDFWITSSIDFPSLILSGVQKNDLVFLVSVARVSARAP